MREKFIIQGGKSLSGTIEVRGAKNAATPILAATLLTSKPCVIDNLPIIEDVLSMIKLIESVGAKIVWEGERRVRIEAKDIDPLKLDQGLVAKMRSSVLIMGPLLARFGEVKIANPGGCIIGARPIDVHLDAFSQMGFETYLDQRKKIFHVKKKNNNCAKEIILNEFSVTATENALMALALRPYKTKIKIAACEPHVSDLSLFLKKLGVSIWGEGNHTIEIKGGKLKGGNHFIIYDAVEAGTFILTAIASKSRVVVKNTPVDHLDLFFKKLKQFGAQLEIRKNEVEIKPWKKLKIDKIQVFPYPGIPTDLQSAFGALSTQAEGLTLIHDPLYDGRLKYLEELNKMGAEIIICDPHRAIINGPSKLYGTELGPLDLRGGAALIMAGLIAQGITVIKDVVQIDRGYEQIEKRLKKLGANIERVIVK